MKSAIALGILACLYTASASAQEDIHAKLSAFVTTGQTLYDRATVIIAHQPKTNAQADLLAVLETNQWHADESEFRRAFGSN